MKLSLRAARVNAGLSQSKAGEMIGVSTNTIHRWECGITFPGVNDIPAIERAYGVVYDQIDFNRT